MSPFTTCLVVILGSLLAATTILGHPLPQANDGTIGIMGSAPAPNGTISVMVPGEGVSVLGVPSSGFRTVLEPIIRDTIAILRAPQNGMQGNPIGSIIGFPRFGRPHRPTGTGHMSGPPQTGTQADTAVIASPPQTGSLDGTAVISGSHPTGTQDDTAVISGSMQTGTQDGTAPMVPAPAPGVDGTLEQTDLTVRNNNPTVIPGRRILPISLTCTEQGCADGSECDPTTRQCRSVAIEI